MFILCPHCQFLVAIEPASGLPPAHCPRCGKALAQSAPLVDTRPQKPGPAEGTDGRSAAPRTDEAATPAPAPASADGSGDAAAGAPSPAIGTSHDTAFPQPDAGASDAGEERAPESGEHLADATLAASAGVPALPAGPVPAEPTPAAASEAALPARPARRRTKTAERTAPVAEAESRRPRKAATKTPATGTTGTPAAQATGAAPSERVESAKAAVGNDPAAVATAPSAITQARVPSFAHATRSPARRAGWRPFAAIAGLALLLAMQVLLADRAALAADARWRPLVATLCDVVRCTLPAWHEPAAFTLLARDVRPARPGVLHVSASFRNDARWPQAWPLLHLALQDVDGRTVGARTLRPVEYLGRAPLTQNRLATGQVASVAFDVAEPGATVVAFTFDFR